MKTKVNRFPALRLAVVVMLRNLNAQLLTSYAQLRSAMRTFTMTAQLLALIGLWLPCTTSAALLTQLPSPVLYHGDSWDAAYAHSPKVLHVGTTYYMFYSGFAYSGAPSGGYWYNIALATSQDGINWTKVGLVLQPTLDWEAGTYWDCSVCYEDGVFEMWYVCGWPGPSKIGYARSTDGVTWTKSAGPILETRPGKFDSQLITGPKVVRRGGNYHMVYNAFDDSSTWRVGYAWSTDGISWVRSDTPVTGLPALAAANDMIVLGQQILLVYSWASNGDNNINLAASADFVTWTNYPDNPILVPLNSWEESYVVLASLLLENNRFRLWYTGGKYDPPRDIGYAEGPIPDWIQPFTMACPPDVATNTDPGQCYASHVDLGTPTTIGEVTSLVNDAPSEFPKGITVVTWTATGAGGKTNTCRQTVTVIDKELPTVTALAASPNRLWPANHKLVAVTVSVSATDNCGVVSSKIVSVTCNEPVNRPGSGQTMPDWQITGDLTLDLRAERSGAGNGRIYTISVQCTDTSGNSSTATVPVTVPQDQRK